jgi:arylsulfatase
MSAALSTYTRVACGLLLACGGCRRAAEQTALDLAREAGIATRQSRLEIVSFGAPAAEAHQMSGFVWAEATPAEDGFSWVEPKAELVFGWPQPRPRTLVLDLAPWPGLAGQRVAVAVNDVPAAEAALEQQRKRYSFLLPAEAQRPGRNVVTLTFGQASAPQKPLRKRFAAVAYGLVAAAAEDPALVGFAAAGTPPPISVSKRDDGSLRLLQAAPTTLRFAVQAPEAATLRFTPALHETARAPGARVTMRVSLETETGPARTLWSQTFDAQHPAGREVSLSLGVPAGTPARLGLEVTSGPDERFAWAVWGAPRLLGRGAVDPLRETLESGRAATAQGSSLRASLAGCNVVLILLDAAGARHFSSYGYSRQTTPEIDRQAAEGAVFEQAYSPVGFTLLAVSSLWTSQHPDQHHNGVPYNARLPGSAKTLAELLSANGVHTAAFVANAFAGTAYGLDQGFSQFEEIYRTHPRAGAEIFPELMRDWLKDHRNERFFAYLHFREPHFPYDPHPPYNTLFGPAGPLSHAARTKLDWSIDVNWKRATASPAEVENLSRLYDGNLRYADDQIAALREALKEAGIWDRTVVMVTGDHGDALHEHGFIGHLNWVYADVVHIPLILHWPKGRGPAGVRVKGLVDLTDVAPTIADIFGIDPPESFRGRSLLPLVTGAPGKAAVLARTAEDQPKYALRHDRYLYIYYSSRGEDELYDLTADPGETHDISDASALRCDWYRQTLHRWILEQRRGPRATTEKVELSAEQKENLRALGYVQ